MNQLEQFEKFKEKNIRRLKSIRKTIDKQKTFAEALRTALDGLDYYICELEESP